MLSRKGDSIKPYGSVVGRHNIVRIVVGLLLVTSILSLMDFATVPAAVATFPGTNGRITFESNRDGNSEIYAMNADGLMQTWLTNYFDFDGQPRWSPDGTKIAFVRDIDTSREIHVMNANGSGQTR